jgi:UDP-N-acetylmuramyl pentapeptide synthase
LIDDTYNLSENGLLAWIQVLNSFTWNKVLVLEDILELWKQAKKIHFKLWKKIAEKNLIDEVLFCWVNYKENFIEWLLEWWFSSVNILNNLNKIKKSSIILFEGKRTKKYLEKLK